MWFVFWMLFVVILLLLPLSYGWGYRGWGPPYPRAYRRTPARAEDEVTWGVLADVLWVIAVVALIWLVVALLI